MIKAQNYIYGEFEETESYLDSYNPSTGKVWATIPDSNADIVDRAVVAAKSAMYNWIKVGASKRAYYLLKAASVLEHRLEEFASIESKDSGKTLSLAKKVDIPRAIHNFRCFAQHWQYLKGSSRVQMESDIVAYSSRFPVGVVGLIIPWNMPLYLLSSKIAPALMAGNTVVIKPSEYTSVSTWKLCKLFDDIGLPRGVINLVCGLGHKAGEALVRHPTVKAISFTGSTKVGKRIAGLAAPWMKKLCLEMSSKNAGVIFDDVDINKIISVLIKACFVNQGETCLSLERLYIQESVYEHFKERFVERTKKLKVGDPEDHDVFIGPLISLQHLENVRNYVDIAVREGASIECGEPANHMGDLDSRLEEGYYLQPTIITELPDTSPVMREEIFGPVVCLTPFSTLEEVVQRINDVNYGLCASVFTKNLSLAHKTAALLHVGTVCINSWLGRDLSMPFGGMKMSGCGKEGLLNSLETYMEEKTISVQISE